MSQDLVRKDDDDDGFGVQEPRSGLIVGAMVKFADRDYTVDKTEKLPENTTLVALSTVTAWVKWAEGRPIERRITCVGQAHPQRDDLPDQDESLWEVDGKFTGKPTDPWKDSRFLYLIDPKSGRDFTFTTDTYGGRAAVGELKSAISNVRRARSGVVPLVRLGWKMMSTQFGPRPRPMFEVVEWRDGGSNDEAPRPIEPADKRGAIEHRKAEFEDEIPF